MGWPTINTYINRAASFTFGAAFTYAFVNPDETTVYDFFPTHKQNKYAFITMYEVNEEDSWRFTRRWKDVARFYQSKDGYLFTQLNKAKSKTEDGKVQYCDISTWTAG